MCGNIGDFECKRVVTAFIFAAISRNVAALACPAESKETTFPMERGGHRGTENDDKEEGGAVASVD